MRTHWLPTPQRTGWHGEERRHIKHNGQTTEHTSQRQGGDPV
nr:MAG TPA: hypothetical protein [Caudoviricetes sp.]